MDTHYPGSCETILSLIKATNVISSELTTSKNLQESLKCIFAQLKGIPALRKTWVFSQSDSESFINIFTYGDEVVPDNIHSDHPLFPVLCSDKHDFFDISLLKKISGFKAGTDDKAIVIPSIINNEILASSLAVVSCSKEDEETIVELLSVIFIKIGSIIGRIEYEKLIKEQQTNLNNILAGIDHMLFVVNEAGRVLHFNLASQRTLGYNEDELSQMSYFDFKSEEDKEAAKQELHDATVKGRIVSYLPYICTNRRSIPAETTISRGIWNSRPILILIAKNLTYFEDVRNEIVLARIKAEQANKAKSQFLRKMSHQFRVPLNSILGMTELLMKTDLDKKQFNFMNIILKSTENLMGILNDILDFSKIENNEIVLEKKCFNLKDVINLVLNTGYYSTQNKGVELLSNYGRYGNDTYLKGDPLRLFQILMNLVQFSTAETDKGKVEIIINEEKAKGNNSRLCFKVTDTSNGLSPEELEELVANIGSSQQDFLHSHAYSGLGLSIAWNLVNIMGGKLEITSSANGNNFEFALDIETCTKEDFARQGEQEVGQGKDNIQNFRILLAEDQVFNQMVIQALVEEWGFSIDIAENGTEALKKLKENANYNLVLMDIQMPVMDGMEATKMIRNEFPSPISEVPIIAITAHAYADEHRKFIAAGMNDTVTKPFRSLILFQKIANCLGISKTDMGTTESMSDMYTLSMNKETAYDLTVVKNITKGNQEAFNKMILVFIEKSNEEMNNLKAAFSSKNWVMVTNTAHKMKPALAYMGMKELEQEVNNLYYISKSQPDETILKNIIASVEIKLNNVCERLKKEMV